MNPEELGLTTNLIKTLVIRLAEDKHLFILAEYLPGDGFIRYLVKVDDNRNVISIIYLSKILVWDEDDLINSWLDIHFICDAPRRVRPICEKNSYRAKDWYILSKEGKDLVSELTIANVWPYSHLTGGAGVLTVERLEKLGLL